MTTSLIDQRPQRALAAWLPGLSSCATAAAAAGFMTAHYGGPVLLYALLLGLALNFLSQHEPCKPGLEIASSTLLRAGVALLGLQVTLAHVVQLGWDTLLHVAIAVPSTLLLGVVLSRSLGLGASFGLQAAGAVAICGVSASMAIAAVLPRSPTRERDSLFIAVGISCLSASAMILYPLLALWMGLDAHATGEFLGGTIHDVAQAVGAGFSVSQEAGQTATLVKLSRVTLLLPLVGAIALIIRWCLPTSGGGGRPKVPWFLFAFAALAFLRNALSLDAAWLEAAQTLSKILMTMAIAAIGMKTRLQGVLTMGLRPLLVLVVPTLALALGYLVLLAPKG